MKEVTTVVTATITKVIKLEDNDEIILPTKEDVCSWMKDMLDANDVQVSKVKNFVMEK